MTQRVAPILVAGLLALATLLCLAERASGAEPVPRRTQYIYVLRVVPSYHAAQAWTDKQSAVIGQHFERLAQAVATGEVILAGKTSEAIDQTFGIVIFEADNAHAARQFMQADPAVMAGIMSATLHPYVVALQRKL